MRPVNEIALVSVPIERLQSLKHLHDSGLKTWVSIEPYPMPNIVEQDFHGLLHAVSFVDKIIFGKWNYNPVVANYLDREKFYMERADEIIRF